VSQKNCLFSVERLILGSGRQGLQPLRGAGPLVNGGIVSVLAVICGFRFEVRPEDEVVELQADHRTVHVCLDCLTLLTVHRRVHHMKVERLLLRWLSLSPCWLKR